MSQHPEDLKPRGVKAPMHLIPWADVPTYDLPIELEGVPAIPTAETFELVWYRLRQRGVTLGEVACVFEHGAKKYARDNWREFAWDDAARDCYFGAICRHLVAHHEGQEIDPESGCRHLAHAACGCLIALHHLGRS